MDDNVSGKDAVKLHAYYQGKIETIPKCWISSLEDFAVWYTPGVAEVCKTILAERDRVFDLTLKWNTIAVVSDGTRVLGLGNIGPEAALPVMEGKALLFKYLGGVDAVPLCLNTTDEERIVGIVKAVEPSFGGINLEDIEKPKCFSLLERLKHELSIPVWHDDQQGTATIVCAGLINALKVVGKKLDEVNVAMVGVGAANVSVERLIVKAGVNEGKIVMVDSKGILSRNRRDLEKSEPYKWALCLRTNFEGKDGGIAEALDGADVCIAMSRQGPGVIKKEWIKKMNDNPIVFSCANPIPEIWPYEAKDAGAKVVATARSDFPNQLNNSLVFPGIFRGALDVRAKGISDGMCLAAAYEIAKMAEEKGLSEEYIVPTMEEWDVYPREAAAAAYQASLEDLARKKTSMQKEYDYAREIIFNARRKFEQLKLSGLISNY
ncbi:MAG: NADP-dependent malic enzyme [Nitrososphaeria archaeon]|nr:NADP-dependent malic enzyme [Nitrososphaeria archaeon]